MTSANDEDTDLLKLAIISTGMTYAPPSFSA